MSAETERLALSVPGSLPGLAAAVEAFDRFSTDNRLPDAVRRSIQVVLDELLSNTVRHGRDTSHGVTIDLLFRLGARTLHVEIGDDGPPFNPLDSADPDTGLRLEERPVGGLGLMLVRSLVDEISYVCEGNRNQVILAKRLEE